MTRILAYEKMGSPVYPTQAQLQKLRDSVELGAPEIREITGRRAEPDAAGERPGSDCSQVGRSVLRTCSAGILPARWAGSARLALLA